MSDIVRATGLIDEPFIAVYPTAAKYLGINKAAIIQQLHYLLNMVRTNEKRQGSKAYHFVDGEWWIYNSFAVWQEDHFPWLSVRTLKKFFAALEADGLIKSRTMTGKGTRQVKWYTIDYTAWNQFVLSAEKKVKAESATPALLPPPESATPALLHATSEKKSLSEKEINIVSASETALPSVSEQKPAVSTKKVRKPDEMFEAIATVWKTRAGGFVGQMKAMFLGRARSTTEWGACNFEPAATPDEILTFGKYAEKRRVRENCSFPKTPETIQRWFYDMREAMKPKPAPSSVIPYTFTLTPDPEVNAARLRESVSL